MSDNQKGCSPLLKPKQMNASDLTLQQAHKLAFIKAIIDTGIFSQISRQSAIELLMQGESPFSPIQNVIYNGMVLKDDSIIYALEVPMDYKGDLEKDMLDYVKSQLL